MMQYHYFTYRAMQILGVVRPMELDCQFLVTARMLFETFYMVISHRIEL